MDWKNDEVFKLLIEKGKLNGSLTYDEVNQALPEGTSDGDRLAEILEYLEQAGINIIDEAEAGETTTDQASVTEEVLVADANKCRLGGEQFWFANESATTERSDASEFAGIPLCGINGLHGPHRMTDDENRLRINRVTLRQFFDDLADRWPATHETQTTAWSNKQPATLFAEFHDLTVAITLEKQVFRAAGPVQRHYDGDGFVGGQTHGNEQPGGSSGFAVGDGEVKLAGAINGEKILSGLTLFDHGCEFGGEFDRRDVGFKNHSAGDIGQELDTILRGREFE